MKNELKQFIVENLEFEYQIAGEAHTEDLLDLILVEGRSQNDIFEEKKGGRDFDYDFTLKFLAEVVSLSKLLFEMYKFYHAEYKSKGVPPEIKKIKKKVKEKASNKRGSIPEDLFIKLIDFIESLFAN
ncbi:MAG: hypothetical protein HUU34_15305 [Saprospiraceae bacterium]|nr:hypothetical protein [Saprospiraceae bacterium]